MTASWTISHVRYALPLLVAWDDDLLDALGRYRTLVTSLCVEHAFLSRNSSRPSARELQQACYERVRGRVSAQMTTTAVALVAERLARGSRRHETHALVRHLAGVRFLVGPKGRDARLVDERTVSIWTPAGRKRLAYRVPEKRRELFAKMLEGGECVDLFVRLPRGRLAGPATHLLAFATFDVPSPPTGDGRVPIGVSLDTTPTVGAVNAQGEVFLADGAYVEAVRRAEQSDTRLLRRAEKELGQRQDPRTGAKRDTRSLRRLIARTRTRLDDRASTFAQTVARELANASPDGAALVFEELCPPPSRTRRGRARRASKRYELLRAWLERRAEERGLLALSIAALREPTCSRCGRRGAHEGRVLFVCSCGHTEHAAVNAARVLRNRFTALRGRQRPRPDGRGLRF